MNNTNQSISIRWLYMVVGTVVMLFAGVIYAWSILKTPFSTEFGWSVSELAMNFTITMCFFCTGGLVGAKVSKKIGVMKSSIIAGILSAAGFIGTSLLNGGFIVYLYLSYGLIASLGIGIAYNVVVATVGAWFPDRKGFCSGTLMMGFGSSALVLGNLAAYMMASPVGWRNAYRVLGISLGIVLIVAGLIIKRPSDSVELPKPKQKKNTGGEKFEVRDYTAKEMLSRPSFWIAFTYISLLSAVGSSVISFARDLALSVNATTVLATALVGVLSVCNGLGRILTGALFDVLGRRKTMIAGNILTIAAAGVTLGAVKIGSLPVCILGLCLSGLSYGYCPTMNAAFASSFYGMKYFPTNVALMTFTVMMGSLIATLSNVLLVSSGGYTLPFIVLLVFSFVALVLNLNIKRP